MIILDDVISNEQCKEYIEVTKLLRKDMLPHEPLEVKDVDETLVPFIKHLLEREIKSGPFHNRWAQMQVWVPGSFSPRHLDKQEEAGDSNYTSLLYLNDDFDGGVFHTDTIQIKPIPGRLVHFKGPTEYHGITRVENNTRYNVIFWWKSE
jgi:hypothetical protein